MCVGGGGGGGGERTESCLGTYCVFRMCQNRNRYLLLVPGTEALLDK